MKFETIEYTVPEHWICAIVNGDESSFDYYDNPADYAAYQAFCNHEIKSAMVEVVGEESYFAHYHDASGYDVLACHVVDCLFHFPITEA
jgi:hypothetical protein